MVGSVGLSLVQFRFNVGEVSVRVEDDVRFSCGSICFNVGSGGSVLVLVWFSLVQVGSGLVQFLFSLGSVLIQFGSVLAQFWFRFVHFGLCWLNLASVLV